MDPLEERYNRTLKLAAVARTVSAIAWIAVLVLAIGAPKPTPLWVLVSLAVVSVATVLLLAMWKRMAGKTVFDQSFGALAFLIVVSWVFILL